MDILDAVKARHSVRNYTNKLISNELLAELRDEVSACNKESGLNIQLIANETKAFDGLMAHYGKFSGVMNYIAIIGKKGPALEEKAGYYGERIALKAQMLGLNTCWVAMSFSKGVTKKHCSISSGEKIVCVLSLGYGKNQGVPHNSKPLNELCSVNSQMPDWFKKGMECALLAPTAMNQQKFLLSLKNNTVTAKSKGGFYSKTDLGIVKYHFEIGAGKDNFRWG